MTDITDFRQRAITTLNENGAIFDTGDLDEAFTKALDELSHAAPNQKNATLVLASASKEVSLASYPDIIYLYAIWWPYVATGKPSTIANASLVWYNGAPTLELITTRTPVVGESLRMYYGALHTIDGLNGATATTVPRAYESKLVIGACAHAAQAEYMRRADTLPTGGREQQTFLNQYQLLIQDFRTWLANLPVPQTAYVQNPPNNWNNID